MGRAGEELKSMRARAILSRTTSDMIKSKVLSPDLVQLVLDCYMKPEEYAKLINEYFSKEFVIEINDGEGAAATTAA